MTRPKLLDLFCKAGGATWGYYRAGFDVTGVDIEPQPNYPRSARFVQGDALAYALAEGWRYDAIHASPPCQVHSNITRDKSRHIDLIPQTRFVLETLGLPYVIENVRGAKKVLRNPIMLCGCQFPELRTYRPRYFESNVFLFQPPHYPHGDKCPPAGKGLSPKGYVSITRGGLGMGAGGADYRRMAMGIDWMTADEIQQAIPPVFTEYIGRQLMAYVTHTGIREGKAA